MQRPARKRGLLDAERFLALTDGLRELHERVESARVSAEQKARWQRRIVAITNAAKEDLDRADEQLRRFSGELDRQLRRR
ncbi:MAG TPA: hypothetical protein VHF25_13585 [Nitriliruptorales bacterium]|nr:hypothetical protein [Nitriliruptorales bacterium]